MIAFTICTNQFLKHRTDSFYHVPYTRMGNPSNPDYLNDLKNTFNDYSQTKLASAVHRLNEVLLEDLPKIRELLGYKVLTICVVPRAKAENSYKPTQQLFRKAVQDVILRLSGFEDGTGYIRRHTDTRTTHLPFIRNHYNGGAKPYPGITEHTCTISNRVSEKNILLIDDIYTPGVNIDEDAICALHESGASTVHFYAIGRVGG